jgi:hypothetical protein
VSVEIKILADNTYGAELSLTVPITNSLAFLFTVLGEWFAEGKVISRGWWPPVRWILNKADIHCRYMDWHATGFDRYRVMRAV